MSFEINDGRTPPTVMLSITPTAEKEFNYPQNAPLVLSAERFKDVSNLKVNQRRSRSFTPVKGSLYLRSPEISPIGVTTDGHKQHTPEVNTESDNGTDSLTPGQLKVPQLVIKTSKITTPTGPMNVQQQHHHHCQAENQFGILTPKGPDDPNQTQSLDKSASHGYLNHNLDVRLILKNASMQQYIKAFNKEKIDFEKFLTLCEKDLLRLGVKRKIDRKAISSLINDLNAN